MKKRGTVSKKRFRSYHEKKSSAESNIRLDVEIIGKTSAQKKESENSP
ncbi:MAG: hypothetical protein IKY19_03900 [Bacteroidaceae bacterium]|nr:hypothetical protein [Bacteroidaceae bacterium]